MKGYTPQKELDTTLGSYKAKDITYSATIGEDVYRYRQVLTKVAGRFYLFTYSSKTDSFDRWPSPKELAFIVNIDFVVPSKSKLGFLCHYQFVDLGVYLPN